MSFFGSIGSLFSPDSAPINKAAAAENAAYKSAAGTTKQYTGQGISTLQGSLPQWQQIFGQGTAMAPTYMGALGVGSPTDIANANTAFMSSIPGQEYQNQLPDIYEAALRRGGLTGQTGQIPIDLTNETMKALNQFYPGWQANLNPLPYESAGASGITGVNNAISGAQIGEGSTLAGYKLGQGQTTANAIAARYAQQQAAGQTGLQALFAAAGLGVAGYGAYNKPATNTFSLASNNIPSFTTTDANGNII